MDKDWKGFEDLLAKIGGFRFRFNDEKQLQGQVSEVLTKIGCAHEREWRFRTKAEPVNRGNGEAANVSPSHRLTVSPSPSLNRDIVDFWLPEFSTFIEVKIRGALIPHLRQCERYLRHEEVQGGALVRVRASRTICVLRGKPLWTFGIWKSLF